MIRKEKTDLLCISAIFLAMIIAVIHLIFCIHYADPPNLTADKQKALQYINTDYSDKIFDISRVHKIDIQIPDVNWNYMVQHATEEEYVICNLMIDDELFPDVAIRPKGNSSLSSIKRQGSDRFSFKIEFDHYSDSSTYYGLDKLSLNNLSSDISCMKDFLTYQMMNKIGIASPLSSYVEVTRNGEPFGLYLAVEAIEDSFCLRNYGTDFGNLYKPECFSVATIDPTAFLKSDMSMNASDYSKLGPGDRVDFIGQFVKTPFELMCGDIMKAASMQYVGEDLKNYDVIFDSAVFDISKEDKLSFLNAVKVLNNIAPAQTTSEKPSTPTDALDVDSLLRYLVVHNFVNNYDSYTGIFDHNYYLREYNGKLSLIPWDYNLAFGIFQMETVMKSFMTGQVEYDIDLQVGEAMDDATNMVNYPIDTPTISVEVSERPLIDVLLKNPVLLQKYHDYFTEFFHDYFDSGYLENLIQITWKNIAPYVQKEQTFYTYDQVEKAIQVVRDYCLLREESIKRQINGTLPSTMEGQRADYENLVDASSLDLSKTITFDGLVWGITGKDISDLLNAISGKYAHQSDGLALAVEEVTKDHDQILPMIGRILQNTPFIQNLIFTALEGPFLLLSSAIVFVIAFKKIKKYRRRKV